MGEGRSEAAATPAPRLADWLTQLYQFSREIGNRDGGFYIDYPELAPFDQDEYHRVVTQEELDMGGGKEQLMTALRRRGVRFARSYLAHMQINFGAWHYNNAYDYADVGTRTSLWELYKDSMPHTDADGIKMRCGENGYFYSEVFFSMDDTGLVTLAVEQKTSRSDTVVGYSAIRYRPETNELTYEVSIPPPSPGDNRRTLVYWLFINIYKLALELNGSGEDEMAYRVHSLAEFIAAANNIPLYYRSTRGSVPRGREISGSNCMGGSCNLEQCCHQIRGAENLFIVTYWTY